MKQKKIITIWKSVAVIIFLFFSLFASHQFVMAQTVGAPDLGLQNVGNDIGLPATDIRLVVARIIRTALGLLGIVALVLILYGGFVWMTAGGDEEKISQSKKILLNSVIGLAIILSSYAIASFVVSKLVEATGGSVTDGGGEAEAVKIHIFLQIFFMLIVCHRGVLCVCVMCIRLLRLTGLLMAQHSMVIWLSKQRMAVFLQGNGL